MLRANSLMTIYILEFKFSLEQYKKALNYSAYGLKLPQTSHFYVCPVHQQLTVKANV